MTLSLILVLILSLNTASAIESQISDSIPASLQHHAAFLASHELAGRYAATTENKIASDYIAGKFTEFGLNKFSNDYKLPFKFLDTLALSDKNDVEFSVLIRKPGVPEDMLKSRSKHWITSEDWIPMRFSPNGSVKGELAFCGYGVSDPDAGYDDYEGIDVKDKIVIVLADSAEGLPLDDFWTPYSDLSYKADNAAKHGAAGIIFVKVLHDSANVFYDFIPERDYQSDIIAIHANRTKIAEFFPGRLSLLRMEKKINKERKPQSYVLPDVSVAVNVDIQQVEVDIDNIIAYVQGSDPNLKDEYILVGANFDGHGAFWDKPKWRKEVWTVFNSADHNASGVSALIELAALIKNNPLKRSVIFAAFNAGMIKQDGAKAFVSAPPVPLEKLIFMLNLNTIGRMKENKLYVIGGGSASNLSHVLMSAKESDSSLSLIFGQKSFYKSDHIPFYLEAIPAIMLTTGIHTDIGTPTDNAIKIHTPKLASVIRFSQNILSEIANTPMKPVFNPDPAVVDYKKIKKGFDCSLGIVPDYEVNPNGLIIADIFRFSSAEKAKLKRGDIINMFDGKKISSFYDLQLAESLTKPGDILELNFIRDGEEKIIKVKMAKRAK